MSSPLAGRRVVVTRSRRQAELFCRKLADKGAEPLLFPTIKTVAVESAAVASTLSRLHDYDWIIFTSVNAVDYFFRKTLKALSLPRTAAIGSSTSAALQKHDVTPEFVPQTFTAVALAVGLGPLSGQQVLIPRSRIGRPELALTLRRQAANVDDIPFYDTVSDRPSNEEIRALTRGADVLTFASPSSAVNFAAILAGIGSDATCVELKDVVSSSVIACIGPTTADQVLSLGFDVDVVAETHTIDGLIQTLEMHFARG